MKLLISNRLLLALLIAAPLAGCGGSGSKGSATTKSVASSTTTTSPTTSTATSSKSTPPPAPHLIPITIKLSSPAMGADGSIPVRYSCNGGSVSLPLSWKPTTYKDQFGHVLQSKLPGAAELLLYIFGGQTINGNPSIDWAVAGLTPGTTKLDAGKLPPGAVVGRNSAGQNGYSLCPAKGALREPVAIVMYALPRKLALQPGFDPYAARAQASNISTAVGSLFGSYYR